jgi:hypothetical protein
MSDLRGAEESNMGPAFDQMLWRDSLANQPAVPRSEQMRDWAELLAGSGAQEAADLLFDVVALHSGFSSFRRDTGVAQHESSATDLAAGWTVRHASDELAVLAKRFAKAGLPTLKPPAAPRFSGWPNNPAGIGPGVPMRPSLPDIGDAARTLRTILSAPEGHDLDRAEDILARLRDADLRYSGLDYRAYRYGPLTLLVNAIATVGLIDFALSTRDLVTAPLGSIAFLHHAAHLDRAGLGPYFSNVGRLVRNSQDLFDLAMDARNVARASGDSDADTGSWITLLSRGCKGPLLCEIVDDLGDLSANDVLSAILDRIEARSHAAVEWDMVLRVRDTALDNLDYGTAARAQRIITKCAPDSDLEALILGSIEASGGEYTKAEDIYRTLLARSPNDEDLLARLIAVKANQFDAFVVTAGFGSPADRVETRMRRRGVTPDYPRRRGMRIAAVDVR